MRLMGEPNLQITRAEDRAEPGQQRQVRTVAAVRRSAMVVKGLPQGQYPEKLDHAFQNEGLCICSKWRVLGVGVVSFRGRKRFCAIEYWSESIPPAYGPNHGARSLAHLHSDQRCAE